MSLYEDQAHRPARRGASTGAVVILALLFGFIGGVIGVVAAPRLQAYLKLPLSLATTQPTGPTTPATQPVSSVSGSRTFADIAQVMEESVVNINTTAQRADPMTMFFGNGPQVVQGLGTGVIVDAQGYILTNFHVVGEAQKIEVTVMHASGKRVYPAKFIGGDKQEDLAVIKIEAPGLKPVTFGNSDRMRPGDAVMAIGNPFGFEHTVSVGVISALNRNLPVDESVTLKHMIQTDATINPGNSGGPLVNAEGQVIGINSAIFVGNGQGPQASGIGFSIPSNRAAKIMQTLRQGKKIAHPYIGISYAQITDELRKEERLPVKDGYIVRGVLPKSPAAASGLQADDIILQVDGKTLHDQDALSNYISDKSVGATITLKVKRWDVNASNWVDKDLRVKIADKPAELEQQMQQHETTPQPQEQPQGGGQESPFPFPF